MTAEPNFEGHEPRGCGEHRTAGAHRAWCYDCSEWCYPDSETDLLVAGRCNGCRVHWLEDRLIAVIELVKHARSISPSPSMHVYVADLERALGREAARPHKLGQRDEEQPQRHEPASSFGYAYCAVCRADWPCHAAKEQADG